MLLTIGAMLTTRSTMAELAVVAISLGRSARTRVSQLAAERRAARLLAQQNAPAAG